MNATKNDCSREQWILAKQLSTAVMCMNAPFCDSGPAEGPNEKYLEKVSQLIADETSIFALEDVIPVLQRALDLKIETKI